MYKFALQVKQKKNDTLRRTVARRCNKNLKLSHSTRIAYNLTNKCQPTHLPIFYKIDFSNLFHEYINTSRI